MSRFGIIIKTGETVEIPDQWIKEWEEFYPRGMIEGVLRDAAAWSLDNPSKRKTKRGLRAFVGGWIRREYKKLEDAYSHRVGYVGDKHERRN